MFYVKKGRRYAAQDGNKEQGEQFYWVNSKSQALKFTNEFMAKAHAENNLQDGEVVEE